MKYLIIFFLFFLPQIIFSQKVAVVDLEKVFDGYVKVKAAYEELNSMALKAKEEIKSYKDELSLMVADMKEMENKLRKPSFFGFGERKLKDEHQKLVKQAKEKRDDMLAYEKRVRAIIDQRQKNYLFEHLGDIRKAIYKMASIEKIDVIINTSDPPPLGQNFGVFFGNKRLDITQQLLSEINSL